MRCDLHVHTLHSGPCTVPVLRNFCRESYNDPGALYEVLKSRGMDLVTVTDHDSIDAAERFRHRPDFFLSEEITCTAPSGTSFHIGVYDLTERDHIELQRRRDDLPSLVACLRERRLMTSINHIFSSLTGRRSDEDFLLFEALFPLVETLNGHIPGPNNAQAGEFASRAGRAAIGGSDSHTLHSAGSTYTEVPGARTKEEFLAGLCGGRSVAAGHSGSYWKLTRAVLSIGLSMMRDDPRTLLLAPLAAAVPLVTLVHCLRERWFLRRWAARLEPLCDEPLLFCNGGVAR